MLHVTRRRPLTSASRRKATREKVSAHRARLRAQGLRPIQLWVPDTRSPAFAHSARRQARAIARSRQEADDLAFVDSISLLRDE
ncbi:MAG TPA: antitoxin MazE family protein [Xanthobacteraceae bacterium]|nr:antitoxin MazE family protein [Xanthobacteraceae bacterium]